MSGSNREADTKIRAVYATWFAAMESADVERGLSVISPEVIHETPDGTERFGREELGRALDEFHGSYAERVSWVLESVVLSRQEAEVRIRETAVIRPRDGGASFRIVGKHAARLRRAADGSWLIAEDRIRLEGEPVTIPHEFDL